MRQKKSNIIYYIVAIVVIALIGFVTFTEIPVETVHVKEIIK